MNSVEFFREKINGLGGTLVLIIIALSFFDMKAQGPEPVQIELSGDYIIKINGQSFNETCIDTLQITRRRDTEGKFVGGYVDNVNGNGYFLTNEIEEMIGFKADFISNWQGVYNFKRIKEFGVTTYEEVFPIPFQYVEVFKLDNGLYATVTDKQVRITSWVNGVKFKEFFPGQSFEVSNGWQFYFAVPSSGLFKMEVENKDGDIITYEVELK